MKYTRANGLTSWYLRVRASGARHRITLGTELDGWTEARAQIELQNVLARIQAGIWEPPREPESLSAHPTLHEFASAWLARRKPSLKPRTYDSYRYLLTNHLLPTLAPLPMSQIDYAAIECYVASKQAENDEIRAAQAAGAPLLDAAGRPRRPLANSTINASLELLNLVLDNAVRRKVIPANPGRERGLRLKEHRRRQRNILEIDELEDLLAAAEEMDQRATPRVLALGRRATALRSSGVAWKVIAKQLGVAESTAIYYANQAVSRQPSPRRTIIACFAGAGPRNSELCAMSIRDVDLRHRHIDIPDAKPRPVSAGST